MHHHHHLFSYDKLVVAKHTAEWLELWPFPGPAPGFGTAMLCNKTHSKIFQQYNVDFSSLESVKLVKLK